LTPQLPSTAFSGPISFNREKEKTKIKKVMGWNAIDLKKSGGDFSSVNTFPPKLKTGVLDLSVLNRDFEDFETKRPRYETYTPHVGH
jgi:hypothetical protein